MPRLGRVLDGDALRANPHGTPKCFSSSRQPVVDQRAPFNAAGHARDQNWYAQRAMQEPRAGVNVFEIDLWQRTMHQPEPFEAGVHARDADGMLLDDAKM